MKIKSLLQSVLPEFPDTLPNNEIEVLKEIPVETLYFALKKADDETALWVYSNARVEQIQGLLDLDCWNGDEFIADRYNEHFKVLATTAPQRLWELSKWIDPEIFVRGLLDQVTVLDFDPQEPPEVMEQDLMISPDSKYVLIMKTPNPDLREALYQWMNKLSAVDIDLLRRHLESCKWEQVSDLEEFGYQIKKGRLEDLGFVEREEAISLYSKGYNAVGLKLHLLANPLPANSKSDAQTLDSAINTELLPEKVQRPLFSSGFLSEAISAIDSEPLKRILYQELIRTVNAMIVADDLLHEEIEVIGAGTKRSRLYIDLGLAYLSDATPERGAEMLKAHRIFDLYRLGWLLVQDLAKVASEIKNSFSAKCFGAVDSALLNALHGRHPKLPTNVIQDLDIDLDDFVHLEGVTKVGERIAQLQLLAGYFASDLKASLQLESDELGNQESAYTRLMTGIFRQACGLEFSVKPISADEWKQAIAEYSKLKVSTMVDLIVNRSPEAAKPLLKKRISEESELLEELVKHHKTTAPSGKFVSCVRLEHR
jgi:hypothetical protein